MPLHWTAEYNNPEVAKVLLANGAQVNVRDKCDRTALCWARHYPEMEAAPAARRRVRGHAVGLAVLVAQHIRNTLATH